MPLATEPRLLVHTWGWKMDSNLGDSFRKVGTGLHAVKTAVRYLPVIYSS